MTKLLYSFKYFDNFLSLFQFVEKNFPFNDHKNNFEKRFNAYPERSLLEFELSQIEKRYKESSGPWKTGYEHRLAAADHPLSTFAVDFILLKEVFVASATIDQRISKKKQSKTTIDKLSETAFLKTLAGGVNDAKLKTHIETKIQFLETNQNGKQQKEAVNTPPELMLLKHMIPLVCNQLPISKADKARLNELLESNIYDGNRFDFIGPINKFADFFRRLKKSSHISNKIIDIQKWIHYHFTFNGEIVALDSIIRFWKVSEAPPEDERIFSQL